MTITLPADPETERLARKLAEATGKPLPMIVRQAIEVEAVKAGVGLPTRLAPSELIARMTEITDEFARLPILDPRVADVIVGYDEHGVPK
jgi:antitoxin VapB